MLDIWFRIPLCSLIALKSRSSCLCLISTGNAVMHYYVGLTGTSNSFFSSSVCCIASVLNFSKHHSLIVESKNKVPVTFSHNWLWPPDLLASVCQVLVLQVCHYWILPWFKHLLNFCSKVYCSPLYPTVEGWPNYDREYWVLWERPEGIR